MLYGAKILEVDDQDKLDLTSSYTARDVEANVSLSVILLIRITTSRVMLGSPLFRIPHHCPLCPGSRPSVAAARQLPLSHASPDDAQFLTLLFHCTWDGRVLAARSQSSIKEGTVAANRGRERLGSTPVGGLLSSP